MTTRTESGNVVLAMYRPKAGREEELRALVARHVPTLREVGLATERPVLLLQASDGTYVEVFEWFPGGAEAAHSHPRVAELWNAMGEVADFASLAELPEAGRPFPHFRAVEDATG
jgi:hypothetical protein